jgi:uncharacterized protein involved in exopolysaccharide biosynthesis
VDPARRALAAARSHRSFSDQPGGPGGCHDLDSSIFLIDTPGGSLKPPAQVEANVQRAAQHGSFRASIIAAAGLDEQVKNGDWPARSGVAKLLAGFPLTNPFAGFLGATSTADEQANHDLALAAVKSSLSAEARGNNLLYIIYRGDSTSTGITLVGGAIDTYQKENLGQTSTEAKAIIDFYTEQVAAAQQSLEQADSDLRAFEAEHPASPAAPRPPSEAQQLGSLQSTYNIRLSQYELALNRQSDAQVRAQASLTTSDNDFQIVDQPHASGGLSLNLQRAAMLTFVGIVFGFGLAGLLIVLRTWFDDTVRRREDVKHSLRARCPRRPT